MRARYWIWIIGAAWMAHAQCIGDLDQNGQVNGADMALILPAWAKTQREEGYLGDLDRDGRVDVRDLLRVHSAQGQLCGPSLAGCPVLPTNHIWNTAIDQMPVHPMSNAWIQTIGANTGFHMDFGSGQWQGAPIGIPYDLVSTGQPLVPVSFLYEEESDPGPYPVPPNAQIEGGPAGTGDRHVLILDQDTCVLYELYRAFPINGGASWEADSGAIYDLRDNALRPDTWTSADAAGLPILPGLVRFEEAESGQIRHAFRFTAPQTQRAYVWPARHFASSSTDPNRPPMGIRVRLKASYNISGFSPRMQTILTALKTYGMMLADNGSPWYISGVPNEGWDNDELHTLDVLRGSDFEVVDVSSLMVDPDSGEALQPTRRDDKLGHACRGD